MDFFDIFFSVVKLVTVNIFFIIAVIRNWLFVQLDVNNVFFNGNFFEEIYMDLFLGFSDFSVNVVSGCNPVCSFYKSIYGFSQVFSQWFLKFFYSFIVHGFSQFNADYFLFINGLGFLFVVLLVYVDDIIITGSD